MNFKNNSEYQYLDLIQTILDNGETKIGRNGSTKSIFGNQMKFSLRNNKIPLLTTKKMHWKSIVEELLFFIRGDTNSRILEEKGVKIWKFNARDDGDIGPMYGFQWRHFGAEYKGSHLSYKNEGIDQLQNCIDTIKNNPTSRRIVVSAWNPNDLDKSVLPPCHIMFQFHVNISKNELSLQFYQRSCDVGLGVPFNITSYSLLLYIVSHITGYKPGDLIYSMGDCHIYENHINGLREQLKNTPKEFPTIKMICNPKNVSEYTIEDFEIEGYDPHPRIKLDIS